MSEATSATTLTSPRISLRSSGLHAAIDNSAGTGNKSTTALFTIRLHFVRKERIGVAQIGASQFLTPRLFARVTRVAG